MEGSPMAAPVLLLGATEADRAGLQQPVVVAATVEECQEKLSAGVAPAAHAAQEAGESHSQPPPAAAASAAEEATLPAVAAKAAESPVASGEQEVEEKQDFSAEPLEARFASKDLNRRCSAYADASAAMEASPDAALFALFRDHVGTCLAETLPKGQDAALSALAAYLRFCPGLEEQAGEVLPLARRLIEHKSIDKPKMQLLAPDAILLVAEVCEVPAVMKEMSDCLSDLESAKKKTQGFLKKQVAFVFKVMQQLLADFGARKMHPKLGYVNLVLKYITDTDRGVREACYGVLLELSAWMGDITEAVKSMEEPQKKELAKRVAALPEEDKVRRQAKRRYRGEAQAPEGQGSAAAEGQGAAAALDTFDVVEAVDALRKLPKGWCLEKVFSMDKWKEKQEHLQVLSGILDVGRLVPCERYADLIPAFQRLLKTECNIPVLTEAAKCVGLMAKGLRRDFERPARQLLPLALARIADKSAWKPNVLIDRVEQMLWAIPFEFLVDELRPYHASKNTHLKKEAMHFLWRALDLPGVQHNCPDAAARFLPSLAASVMPALDDSDNTVKHEAVKFLVLLAHRNHASPDLGLQLLDRIPRVRSQTFVDEWSKLGTDVPCPLEGGEPDGPPLRPATPAARRPSPLRKMALDTSAASEAGADRRAGSQSRPMTPRGGRPASPASGRPPSRAASPAVGRSRQTLAERAGAARGASAAPRDEIQDGVEGMSVDEMAAELRQLRSAVAQLQAAPATPAPAPAEARAMTPRRDGVAMTPQREGRVMTPQQETRRFGESPAQRRFGESPAQRRAESPTRRAKSPLRRAGSPLRRAASPARSGLHRSGSTGSLRSERGQSVQSGAALAFRITLPRITKQARQQRERSLYWGPEQIPADHLAALRECWKPCIDEHVCRLMFSGKMEEQLVALQSWRRQLEESFPGVIQVLDMFLKWLTWMQTNTNTQVWKLVLEVLGSLLEKLRQEDYQLTDREAQVLLPNMLERSGHSITAFRESMVTLCGQMLCLYPRLRVMPFLVLGLGSRNKKSVACVLRVIAAAADRQMAAFLARSGKDLAAITKTLEDKDAEVRKAAVRVFAVLSQHMAEDAFARLARAFSAAAHQAIRVAALSLPPLVDHEACFETAGRDSVSDASAARGASFSVSDAQEVTAGRERRVSVKDPRDGVTAYPSDSPPPALKQPRAMSPAARRLQLAEASPEASPQKTLPPKRAASPQRRAASPQRASAAHGRQASSMREAANGLAQCSGDEFKVHCATLKQGMKQLAEADAPLLAESLVSAMLSTFGGGLVAERCKPLVEVLDEFCASRDCLRPLSTDVLKRLLREQLRNLQDAAWTRKCEDGSVLLRALNLSCVMLLSGITRSAAFGLLLELGSEGSDAVASSLVVKCVRKLIKGLGAGKDPEQEVGAVLEVIRAWMAGGAPASGTLLDGAMEVVDAARCACPGPAETFGRRLEAASESKLRSKLLGGENCGQENLKENLPGAGAEIAKDKRASLAPNVAAAMVPCTDRNSLA